MRNLEDYVADMYSVKTSDLFTPSRKRKFVEARKICMYMMANFTTATLIDIGEYFNRDHATAIHCINKAEEHYKLEPSFRMKMDQVYFMCKDNMLNMPFEWKPDDNYDVLVNVFEEDIYTAIQ